MQTSRFKRTITIVPFGFVVLETKPGRHGAFVVMVRFEYLVSENLSEWQGLVKLYVENMCVLNKSVKRYDLCVEIWAVKMKVLSIGNFVYQLKVVLHIKVSYNFCACFELF